MNDDFLRQFQEDPPDDFGHDLLNRLKQTDKAHMNGYANTVHMVKPPPDIAQKSRYAQQRLLRIAAVMLTLLGAIAAGVIYSNRGADDVQVAVLSSPNIEPNDDPQQTSDGIITAENIGLLQEVHSFGSGALVATRWSADGTRLAAVSSNQVQIFDADLNLLQTLSTGNTPYVDAAFTSNNEDVLIAAAEGTQIVRYHLDTNGVEVLATDANVFAPDSSQDFNRANTYRQIAVAPSGEFFAYTTGREGIITLRSLLDDRVAVTSIADTVGVVGTFDASVTPIIPFEQMRIPTPPDAIAISPDNLTLATYDAGARLLRTWDIQPNLQLTIRHERSWTDSGTSDYQRVQSLGISFSPDNNLLLINTAGEVGIFNTETLNLVDQYRFTGTQSFATMFVSNDVVHVNASATVIRWVLSENRRIPIGLASTLDGFNNAYNVRFHPDGEHFVSEVSGNRLVLWRISDASESADVAEVSNIVDTTSGAFAGYAVNAYGEMVAYQLRAAESDEDAANIWFSSNNEPLQPLIALDTLPIDVAFSTDGRFMFVLTAIPSGVRNRVVYATRDVDGNYAGFRSFYESELGERITALRFSANGQKLYLDGSQLRIVDISDLMPQFDTNDLALAQTLTNNAETNSELYDRISMLTQHPNRDGYAAMAGNILNIWDANGTLRYSEYRREFNSSYLGYVNDGRNLIVTSQYGVFLYDALNGEVVRQLDIETGLLNVEPIPNTSALLVQTVDTLLVWDYNENTLVQVVVPADAESFVHSITPLDFQFSVDLTHLYSTWTDGTIRAFALP